MIPMRHIPMRHIPMRHIPMRHAGHGFSRPEWLRTIASIAVGMFTMVAADAAAAEPPRAAAAAKAADGPDLKFTRVHVPLGKISRIPLGAGRYVPMSVREFEEAVRRVSTASRGNVTTFGSGGTPADSPSFPAPTGVSARYTAAITDGGGLAGTLTFDVGWQPAADGSTRAGSPAREMPLGELAVRTAAVRTAAGTGEALVFGRPGGGMAIATPEAGEYSCEFSCGSAGGTAEEPFFSLPLVPALFSSITLRVPAGLRPLVSGEATAAGATAVPVDPSGGPATEPAQEWRIDCGPLAVVEFTLVSRKREPPPLSLWTDIGIEGRQAHLEVVVQPSAPWQAGEVVLEKSPAVVIAAAGILGHRPAPDDSEKVPGDSADVEVAWSVSQDGRTVRVFLPSACIGRRAPLVLRAFAPIGPAAGGVSRPETLPMLRPARALWAGGGIVLHAEASVSLASVELRDCMAVTPEVAARWPLPKASRHGAERDPAAGSSAGRGLPEAGSFRVRPLRVPLELQGPDASVSVIVQPRVAELDVARVTTVEVSSGIVLGRAACDIRVNRGEAFELAAGIAPGWFIDSVETITWPGPVDWPEGPAHREPIATDHAVDWKVVRDPRGDSLRIGLTVAATPERSLGLRITGHRAGVSVGAAFSSADMEMVRLEGEGEDFSVVEFRTSSDSMVEIDGDDMPAGLLDPRLAMLAEEGTVRGRVRAGARVAAREVRLVRRRPPLDARTQVRLSARDDRLAESFTFECIPERSEIDAVVVHFSEPSDGLLEWSLLPPAGGTIAARRMDPPDRRRADAAWGAGIAESWIVEFNPPAREAVTVRAVRSVPFTAAVPFPLAWIEGASSQGGEVIVKTAGRNRPRILNRRLPELPPGPVDADQSLSTLAEFSFDAMRDRAEGGPPAAELSPGDTEDAVEARAWAWREVTSCWCHASGTTEYETLFEIENHGRTAVALGLPRGKRLQGILVDGVGVPLQGQADTVETIAVELPAGKRFVRLLVRAVAERDPGRGAWRIDSVGGAIDVPVLEREWRVLLPPGLTVAWTTSGHRAVGLEEQDWAMRLFGARIRPPWEHDARGQQSGRGSAVEPRPGTMGGSVRQGFSERLYVPVGGRRGGGEIVVVPSGLVNAAAILAAVLVAGISWRLSRDRPWQGLAACAVAAVVALWAPPPFDSIARAAWWGAVAAACLQNCNAGARALADRAAGAAAAVIMIMACGPVPEAAAQPPAGPQDVLRVFITPVDRGETALVPEQLFRVLTRAEAGDDSAAVRVIASRLLVRRTAEAADRDRWRLELDVDADAGGTLVLDQSDCNARWSDASARIDGVAAAVLIDRNGSRLRLLVNTPGRRRIELGIDPAVSRRGDVETTTVCVPAAPAAFLECGAAVDVGPFAGPDAAPAFICEAAGPNGLFMAAPRSADRDQAFVFDVSRATAVRLVRSLDPRARLAATVRAAESRNDILWELDACRLTAAYDIDAGDEIVRSVVVAADPGLEPVMPDRAGGSGPHEHAGATAGNDPGIDIRPIGGHRWLVERRTPTGGRVLIELPFRMPLADPAGVFSVPGAWIEGVKVDGRTTRLTASRDLELEVEPPDGAVPVVAHDAEATAPQSWRVDVVRTARVDRAADGPPQVSPRGTPGSGQRPRVTVKRRGQALRGSQNLAVAFATDQVRLQLQTRLDATSTALFTIPLAVPGGCEIEHLRLYEDDALSPDSAERGAIDLRWKQTSAGRVVAVVQRPRAGRFRLEVAARLSGRPAASGPLPLLYAELDAGAPLLVTWRVGEGLGVAVRQFDGSPVDRGLEFLPGQSPPRYSLDEEPVAAKPAAGEPDAPGGQPADASAGTAPRPRRPRVELADIHLAVGERGRAWGMARFDLVAAEPVVRIELPAGLRLFDLLVDGRPAGSTVPVLPRAGNVWEVQLFDARWPRSVLAVFAGEIGAPLTDGVPLELSAPTVVGLPCTRTLWTLHVPDGMMLHVDEPARVVDEAGVAEQRRASLRRLEGDFERALAECGQGPRSRLEEAVRLRREGLPLPLEAAWNRGRESRTTAFPPGVSVVTGGDRHGLTIRGVRRQDPTVNPRALATLSILAVGGLAFTVARRRPAEWRRWMGTAGPFAALVSGLSWLFLFSPSWPAWLLVALSAWMAASAWAGSAAGGRTAGKGDRGASQGDAQGSVTQIAPAPPSSSAEGDRPGSTASFSPH